MKRNHIVVLFFLVSLALASCSKLTNGDVITEERFITSGFSAVSIYNNVNVRLVQSDRPHLELTCPKNLIDKVTTELSPTGDTLIIKNENNLNWLRSFDYSIDLTVYYNNLREINYASIGDLKSEDPLHGYLSQLTDTLINGNDTTYSHSYVKAFFININEGSGDIDLNFDCEVVKNKFGNGTSKVTFRGSCGYAELITRSYGLIDASQLNANIVRVKSESSNDVYVWAQSQLVVLLYSIGNIYYKGNPAISVEACTNDGRLIRLEE